MGFLAIAIGAFLFSLVDVGRKKLITKRNTYITIWGVFLCSLPLLIILSIIFGFPESIGWLFWPLVLIVIAAISVGEVFLYKAIKYSDLSDVIPFTAFTPAFLILTSWIILGELPNLWGALGISITVLGAWIHNMKDLKKGWLAPLTHIYRHKGERYIIFIGLIWSVTGPLAKLAIFESSELFFTLVFCTGLALVFTVIVLLKYRDKIKEQFLKHIWKFLIVGSLWAMAAWLEMIAMAKLLVPYVGAIKQTRSLYSTIWGKVIFKEKNIKPRLVGAVVMVIGAILIVVLG
ncbi:DMT family transporter [Patescibacteria group bacterium]|nr:DMT family transporter [Patescibacteria group bacterium]MBU1673930.1 DMT family transporter [Patescibacteria group bacterium]MBU1963924.1 DMT family transporter [Patescibacteria group bacterium]